MRGFLGGVSAGAIVAIAGAAMVSLSVPLVPWGASPQNTATAPVEETAALADTGRQTTAQAQQDAGALVPAGVLDPAPDAEAVQDSDLVNLAPKPLEATAASKDVSAKVEAKSAARPDVDFSTSLTPLPETDSPSVPTRQNSGSNAADVPQKTISRPVSVPQADVLPDLVPDVVSETATAPAVPVPSTGQDVPDLGDRDQITKDGAAGETAVPDIAPSQSGVMAKESEPTRIVSPDVVQPPAIIGGPIQDPAQRPVQDVAAPLLDEDTSKGRSVRSASLPQTGVNEFVTRTPPGERVLPLTERNAQEVDSSQDVALAKDTPFGRNAVSVRPRSGQPYMSIVLIEDESSVGMDALGDFPYPLTVAIDPATPNATKRMRDRRADGLEVMILADLPREGTPQDAEIALPIWFDRLPDAMGVLEGVGTGVQGNRALADQVSAIVGGDGYGLVLQNNGLNTVQKLAAREGVPSGVVFRDFDGAGQDQRAMRRFLDQAAFRARQEEAVIMVGRLKPDTISALLVWGLQDRASKVALMPVSASLKLLQTP